MTKPEPPLEPGDVVRLNSGPVRMTVREASPGKIVCLWHDREDQLVEAEFKGAELTLVRGVEKR